MTFLISARSNGDRTWIRRGDALSVEFPDGKGVSGRIADVSIAPGGLPFSIIVTDDGQWPETSPLGDMIAWVQEQGYVVQEAEDYKAGLHDEYERGRADARPQSTCDGAAAEPEGIDRSDAERALRRVLRDTIVERDLARERVSELSHHHDRLVQDLTDTAEARDYWRRKAHERLISETVVVNLNCTH
jgi:hypothetical protein